MWTAVDAFLAWEPTIHAEVKRKAKQGSKSMLVLMPGYATAIPLCDLGEILLQQADNPPAAVRIKALAVRTRSGGLLTSNRG